MERFDVRSQPQRLSIDGGGQPKWRADGQELEIRVPFRFASSASRGGWENPRIREIRGVVARSCENLVNWADLKQTSVGPDSHTQELQAT